MGQIRLTSNKLSSRQKKCCTLTAAMLLLATSQASAGWRLVYDPWTTGQVGANTTAQKLIENKHNERLDTISEKQKKILQYTATMEGIKELYHLTMTNVRGFGEESAYYKEIFLLSADILSGIPTVTKYIASNPVKNYVLCLNELSDIVIEKSHHPPEDTQRRRTLQYGPG